MQIAIPLFDRFTALDAIGPYEVLSRIPGAQVTFVAAEPGPTAPTTGMLAVLAERPLDDVPRPDVLVVPGGIGTRAAAATTRRCWPGSARAHENSTYTTSVCTGSLVLAAAGILDGLQPRRTGRRSTCSASWAPARSPSASSSAARSSRRPACRPGSTWRCARRAARPRRRRPGDPARHRVRPAAALRRRLAREGPARDRRAAARHRRPGGQALAEIEAEAAPR